MDEKWKLSKKGSKNYSKSRREQSSSSTTATASSSSSSASSNAAPSYLKRSSSMPESIKASRSTKHSSDSGTSPRSFTSRCANLVKERRAKFYIVRRCVTMLMCWRDYP